MAKEKFDMSKGNPDVIAPDVQEIKECVLDYLTQHASGRKNAVVIHQIANAIGLRGDGTSTHFRLRNIIKDMIRDGDLIGSCNDGFFLIIEPGELDEYVSSLERRRQGIGERISSLRRAWDAQHKKEGAQYVLLDL